MSNPRLEINLKGIASNTKILGDYYKTKGIIICAVTKVVCGSIEIANILVQSGIVLLADSKLANIKKMFLAGVKSKFLLIGTPMLSEANDIVKYADISLNSELEVIRRLSYFAIKRKTVHQIILMIELGDLREGILPKDVESMVKAILLLKGVNLVGLGTNLACFGGVVPTEGNMNELISITKYIEIRFDLNFTYISAGNSANYEWFSAAKEIEKINQLRIGESIFLGCEPLYRKPILKLNRNIFTLVAEVTEVKVKASVPYGEIAQNFFGHKPDFPEKGLMERVILGVGLQDVLISGLNPYKDFEILGGSSDHTIINTKGNKLKVGDEVKFNLNYPALLSAMTSPYIFKEFIQ